MQLQHKFSGVVVDLSNWLISITKLVHSPSTKLLQTKFKMASFIEAVGVYHWQDWQWLKWSLLKTVISWICVLQNGVDLCDNEGDMSREHWASSLSHFSSFSVGVVPIWNCLLSEAPPPQPFRNYLSYCLQFIYFSSVFNLFWVGGVVLLGLIPRPHPPKEGKVWCTKFKSLDCSS